MTKSFPLFFFFSFLCYLSIGQINYPDGRIAYSADGNNHDHDDFVATPMALALIKASGLEKKLVHLDYSNHIGKNNVVMDSQMVVSVLGGAERFGFKKSIFFNCQTQLDIAVANFRKEGNKSSEKNPLYYLCAGPMEVPWRCINAVDPAKRKYIYAISHSKNWNNIHSDTPEMTHTWKDISSLGVKIIDINDQNPGTNRPYEEYFWLRDSSSPLFNWLWERGNSTGKNKFDPSDAGMAYYLLTGGPNGGDENCDPLKIKALLGRLIK